MNEHHLIMGRLADFITGRILDDTHDERYRQKIARLLVLDKGYARSEIRTGRCVEVAGEKKSARVPVTFVAAVEGRELMLIQYGPGSLVTRHRPALALSRLAGEYPIPVVVVTNGEGADILLEADGRIAAAGLAHIPSRQRLLRLLRGHAWEPISARRAEMESRIVMAFEVDGRCPCDSDVCTWENAPR